MDRPWDYNEGYEVGSPPGGQRGTSEVRVIPITTRPHSRAGGGNEMISSKESNFVLGDWSAAAPSSLAYTTRKFGQSLLLGFAAGLGWHLSHALAGYLQLTAASNASGRSSSREEDGEEGDASEEEEFRRRRVAALAERLGGKIYAAWRDALARVHRGARDAYVAAGAVGVDWPLVLVFGVAALWQRSRGGSNGRKGVGHRGGGGGGGATIYPLIAAAWLLSSSRGRGGDGDRGRSADANLEDELTLRKDDDGIAVDDPCARSSRVASGGTRSIPGGLARDVSHPAPSPSQVTADRRSRSESVTSQATQTTAGEESVASSAGGGEKKSGAPQQRYLEMLVHNVSHTDLVLSLGCRGLQLPPEKTDPPYALCRPRFSAFDLFTRRILDAVKLHRREVEEAGNGDGNEGDRDREVIISFPRYERSSDVNARYGLVTPRTGRRDLLPVGFDLDRLCGGGATVAASTTAGNDGEGKAKAKTLRKGGRSGRPCRVSPSELPSLRMRGRDVPRLGGLYNRAMHIHYEAAAMGSSGTAASSSAATPRRRSTVEDLAHHSSSCLDASGSSRAANNAAKVTEKGAAAAGDAVDDDDLRLNAVFFPLLSTLMRRWHETISDKYSFPVAPLSQQTQAQQQQRNVKKVVVLVTGVGTPRNWTHTIAGNSTESCAELMEAFINALYPDVTVVRIHSKTNIFRYDENISFAKRELTPCVDAYRDAHARGEPYPDEISGGGRWVAPAVVGPRPPLAPDADGGGAAALNNLQRNPFNPDWKQTFSVTLSFADGSPARTHAIQTSLRPYRPAYFHFWQLKTFWHDTKMCDDDVEVHSFEDMETVPAMEVEKTSPEVRMVVAEMRKFRAHFLNMVRGGGRSNDIREFWLRKTRKPVLAVLLVNDPERGLVLYRGTNMEVSMPTGSLCAERNVIGTALASDPALKREDLRMVAVLAVPLPPSDEGGGRRASLPLLPPPVRDAGLCAEVASPPSETVPGAGAGHAFPSDILTEVGRKLSEQQQSQPQQRPQPQLPPRVQVRARGGMPRTLSAGSFASLIEEASAEGDDVDAGEEPSMADSWVVEGAPPPPPSQPSDAAGALVEPPALSRESDPGAAAVIVPPLPFEAQNADVAALPSSSPAAVASPPGTPVRKVRLYRSSFRPTFGGTGRKKKRTVVVHSAQDINPLKPCGACNEWLKKIAESNPYFRVVTFTDADCNGVYVTPCQD